MPEAHAVLGGSVAEKWCECDAYYSLTKDLPESPPNEYTVEGTALHSAVEFCATSGMKSVDLMAGLVGKKWLKDEPGFTGTYTPEHVELIEHSLAVIAPFLRDGFKVAYEKEVHLTSIDGEKLWGSGDVILWREVDSTLGVIDHKFGKGKIVDPNDNAQGAFYLVGAADWLKVKPRRAFFGVNQPRISKTLQVADYNVEEWRGVFRAAYKRNMRENPVAKPGAHCHWCKAAGTCKALAEQRRLSVRTAFKAEVEAKAGGPVNPAMLSLEERGRLLAIFDDVEAWMKEVRSQSLVDAQAGRAPVGFHITEGRRGARQWGDEERAAQVLEMLLGDEAYERKLLSVAQAEKVLGKAALPAGLVTQAPGKPTLSPIDDGKDLFDRQAQARAAFLT